ncbi:MAG: transcriptional repressor [Helicobacteraceae bacterium CG2_30_36_10]|nr:MAG: transcriptional repressor [Helicobacteraceae bacterium CG2_30_36_10]
MNNYTRILREHNLKATPQRLAMANVLHVDGHISIESLYAVMIEKFTSISLATIYKNINLMVENSFIQEVKIPHAKSVYELTKDTHSHIVCEKCGKVNDVSLDLSTIIDNATKQSNFKIDKTDLVLSGVCKGCQ